MSRLTEKDTNSLKYHLDMSDMFATIGGEVYEKLRPLEDIEDELGIDLITLFKALTNGIWSNHYAYVGLEVHFVERVDLCQNKNMWSITGGFGEGHNLNDYGKTWALTKEELEK